MADHNDRLTGIDVSEYQNTIDWRKVAGAGCAFAFVKATEGATRHDPNFLLNWRSSKEAGLRRGAYHFFRPLRAVADQVANFLSLVKTLESDDLPPVLDLEVPEDWRKIDVQHRVPLILSWVEEIEAKLKRRPIVYMNPSFAVDILRDATPLSPYPLWLAHYTSKPAPSVPAAWKDWSFWQHCDRGQIDGIIGPVDLDWFNGDIKALEQFISA